VVSGQGFLNGGFFPPPQAPPVGRAAGGSNCRQTTCVPATRSPRDFTCLANNGWGTKDVRSEQPRGPPSAKTVGGAWEVPATRCRSEYLAARRTPNKAEAARRAVRSRRDDPLPESDSFQNRQDRSRDDGTGPVLDSSTTGSWRSPLPQFVCPCSIARNAPNPKVPLPERSQDEGPRTRRPSRSPSQRSGPTVHAATKIRGSDSRPVSNVKADATSGSTSIAVLRRTMPSGPSPATGRFAAATARQWPGSGSGGSERLAHFSPWRPTLTSPCTT